MDYPQDEFEGPPGGGADDPDSRAAMDHSLSCAARDDAPSVGAGVMPLDAGDNPDAYRADPDWNEPVSIADASSLGAGLKAARIASGRSLAELSQQTKVHVRYLIALEDGDFDVLPSQVFALGYVRAYAHALGLDEIVAAERFKKEAPGGPQPHKLEAPTGVAFQEVRRYSPRVIGAIALIAVAVVGWNVFQRMSLFQAPPPSEIVAVPESWTLGAIPGQADFRLTPTQAAPADQSIPALYVTPGLEAELTGVDPDAEGAQPVQPTAPVQAAFNPRGAIYGASATASQVILQAKKAASLVVRMGDGRVLFARQLAEGEAWRAPLDVAAIVDVSDPSAFDVYMNGELGGGLQGALTPLGQLNARAEQMARQAAAEVAARAEAARRAAIQAANQAALSTGPTA